MESKSLEDVTKYMAVFLKRYHELKEKDQVILKLQHMEMDVLTRQSVLQYNHSQAQTQVLLLDTTEND